MSMGFAPGHREVEGPEGTGKIRATVYVQRHLCISFHMLYTVCIVNSLHKVLTKLREQEVYDGI
jgi:hypothetical protein